jgi:predicted 2-oxoglutarate/Fe(II)-dependent dioxygenase YbiX
MRVIANIPFGEPEQHADAVSAVLDRLPAPSLHAGAPTPAPVLMLPRVFEPELCRALIDLYEWRGGGDSGFMKDENGRTVAVLDHSFKRRSDVSLEDSPEYESYRAAIRARVVRRILPEIQKAFQFQITRMERYLIACYDSGTGGFFKAHRDNTTLGTVHRRFAVTINLNAEEYEGGDLRFPEFGDQTYRAPTGGCVVFSCGLLHEARPVTRGRRYACLPFLYDEEGAAVRARNRELVNLDVVNRNAAAAGAAIARGAKVP